MIKIPQTDSEWSDFWSDHNARQQLRDEGYIPISEDLWFQLTTFFGALLIAIFVIMIYSRYFEPAEDKNYLKQHTVQNEKKADWLAKPIDEDYYEFYHK